MDSIHRREFLKSSAFALGCAASGSLLGLIDKTLAQNPDKPNVLFFAVDDLNDWINCLGGYPGTITPNLDRLANRGVLFTNAFCSAPACNPSRASLLTGISPSTSGVYGNRHIWRKAMPDAVTLQQHFMAHGYNVVGGGKIFHGRYNDMQSWHKYFKRPNDPVPLKRPVNGIKNNSPQFDWGPVDVSDEEMGDYKVSQWAINYLNQKHDNPFFLACGFFRPHLPWYVPRKYFEMYPLKDIVLPIVKENDLDDVPEIGRKLANPKRDHKQVIETNNWEKAVQGYLASITFADFCVGRVLDALDKSPYSKNTIIVLWGDQGWHLFEKTAFRKFKLWEEANRMPLIIVDTNVTKPGSICRRTVSLLDLYPTFIDLCNLSPKTELEGKSLMPLLKDPNAEWQRPVVMTYGKNNHAVRSERWRYIRYRDGSEELYDRYFDPYEWKNLAEKPQFQEKKEELRKWLPKINAPEAPLDRN